MSPPPTEAGLRYMSTKGVVRPSSAVMSWVVSRVTVRLYGEGGNH